MGKIFKQETSAHPRSLFLYTYEGESYQLKKSISDITAQQTRQKQLNSNIYFKTNYVECSYYITCIFSDTCCQALIIHFIQLQFELYHIHILIMYLFELLDIPNLAVINFRKLMAAYIWIITCLQIIESHIFLKQKKTQTCRWYHHMILLNELVFQRLFGRQYK